jgi:hypothetical protein
VPCHLFASVNGAYDGISDKKIEIVKCIMVNVDFPYTDRGGQTKYKHASEWREKMRKQVHI